MKFTKMHGNGNDFVLIDEYNETVLPDDEKGVFAERQCHRRYGIGADGVLFLSKSDKADIRMRLFQPDRSEAEMCGNGIRCVSMYAVEKGYVKLGSSKVETVSGIIDIDTDESDDKIWVKVNMGAPKLTPSEIPAVSEGDVFKEEIDNYTVYAANTGVPHAVIFVDDLDIPIDQIAPEIRFNPVFPQGANVNIVEIKGDTVFIRTYERGVEGETLSCGTGAAAAVAVARCLGLIKGDVTDVVTIGGMLRVSEENGNMFIEGTAETVYEGELNTT